MFSDDVTRKKKIDPNDMLGELKQEMVFIMNKYRNNEDYRREINHGDFDSLSEIEKIALKDLIVADNGSEVINKDMSNYYEDYNIIDVTNEYGVMNTCMNMAIAELIHLAFFGTNILKFSKYNFEDIKTRMKGNLFSAKDKGIIIKFIKDYNKAYPEHLAKNAKKFYELYKGHLRTEYGISIFISLAHTFNSNIYLYELEEIKENKRKWRFKK